MKAVIVAHQRSGGTFLAACLSNHPDIFCTRWDIYDRNAVWQQRLHLAHAALLDFVLSQPLYQVCASRLTYTEVVVPEIRNYLLKNQVRILHLTRAPLEVVTSLILLKQEQRTGHITHWYPGQAYTDDEMTDCGPEEVLKWLKHYHRYQHAFERAFVDAPRLEIHYADLTTASAPNILTAALNRDICNFLGVPVLPLYASNRKMHQRPVASYYKNWAAIETTLKAVGEL